MDRQEFKEMKAEAFAYVKSVARKVCLAVGSLVAVWFCVVFSIGGSAQVSCSYGRISSIFTQSEAPPCVGNVTWDSADTSEAEKTTSGNSSEIVDETTPNDRGTSSLEARPDKFYTYTLTEGRDFPLTVIVNGDTSPVAGSPNTRSATLSQVSYSMVGGVFLTDTVLFNCNRQMTAVVQTVAVSELMGTNTKVYNAETMEFKPLDEVTIRAFNMVCHNGWDRLAEMIVPAAGIEAFIEARLRATN